MTLAALALTLTPLIGAAQERGALLVASERVPDPRFSKTVLLLLHYDTDGAIGIAINRPTWVSAAQLFPGLPYMQRYRGRIFHGGPLAQANVLVLSRGAESSEPQAEPLLEDIYASTNLEFLEQRVDATTDEVMRFYAGHASWGPGQLDEEIEAGSWRVVSASAERIFSEQPLALWGQLAVSGAEMRARTSSAADTSSRTAAEIETSIAPRPQ
jgi:putative transcriptional regulator